VPDAFEDIDAYKEVFYPLLVEEFKALLERGKREENGKRIHFPSFGKIPLTLIHRVECTVQV